MQHLPQQHERNSGTTITTAATRCNPQQYFECWKDIRALAGLMPPPHHHHRFLTESSTDGVEVTAGATAAAAAAVVLPYKPKEDILFNMYGYPIQLSLTPTTSIITEKHQEGKVEEVREERQPQQHISMSLLTQCLRSYHSNNNHNNGLPHQRRYFTYKANQHILSSSSEEMDISTSTSTSFSSLNAVDYGVAIASLLLDWAARMRGKRLAAGGGEIAPSSSEANVRSFFNMVLNDNSITKSEDGNNDNKTAHDVVSYLHHRLLDQFSWHPPSSSSSTNINNKNQTTTEVAAGGDGHHMHSATANTNTTTGGSSNNMNMLDSYNWGVLFAAMERITVDVATTGTATETDNGGKAGIVPAGICPPSVSSPLLLGGVGGSFNTNNTNTTHDVVSASSPTQQLQQQQGSYAQHQHDQAMAAVAQEKDALRQLVGQTRSKLFMSLTGRRHDDDDSSRAVDKKEDDNKEKGEDDIISAATTKITTTTTGDAAASDDDVNEASRARLRSSLVAVLGHRHSHSHSQQPNSGNNGSSSSGSIIRRHLDIEFWIENLKQLLFSFSSASSSASQPPPTNTTTTSSTNSSSTSSSLWLDPTVLRSFYYIRHTLDSHGDHLRRFVSSHHCFSSTPQIQVQQNLNKKICSIEEEGGQTGEEGKGGGQQAVVDVDPLKYIAYLIEKESDAVQKQAVVIAAELGGGGGGGGRASGKTRGSGNNTNNTANTNMNINTEATPSVTAAAVGVMSDGGSASMSSSPSQVAVAIREALTVTTTTTTTSSSVAEQTTNNGIHQTKMTAATVNEGTTSKIAVAATGVSEGSSGKLPAGVGAVAGGGGAAVEEAAVSSLVTLMKDGEGETKSNEISSEEDHHQHYLLQRQQHGSMLLQVSSSSVNDSDTSARHKNSSTTGSSITANGTRIGRSPTPTTVAAAVRRSPSSASETAAAANKENNNKKRLRSVSPVPGWNTSSRPNPLSTTTTNNKATTTTSTATAAKKNNTGTGATAPSATTKTNTTEKSSCSSAQNQQQQHQQQQNATPVVVTHHHHHHEDVPESVEDLLSEIRSLRQCFSATSRTFMEILSQTASLDPSHCRSLLAVSNAHYTPKYYSDLKK